jgi:hypothetical protein
MEPLHHDERLRLVEMHDAGDDARVARLLPDQRVVFVEGAVQRQGPAFADETDVGQRLLDDDGACGPFDDEDEVEVAVAHLAHAPVGGRAADGPRDGVDAAQPRGQGFGREGFVTGHMRSPAVPAGAG